MFSVGSHRPSQENLQIYQTLGSRRLTDSLLKGNNSPGGSTTAKTAAKSSYFQVFLPNKTKLIPSGKPQGSTALIVREENSSSVRSVHATPLDQLFLSRKNALAVAASPLSPQQEKSGGFFGKTDQFSGELGLPKAKFTLGSKKNSATSTLSDPHRKTDALKVKLVEFEKRFKQPPNVVGETQGIVEVYHDEQSLQSRMAVAGGTSAMHSGFGPSVSGSVPNIASLIAKTSQTSVRGAILQQDVYISQDETNPDSILRGLQGDSSSNLRIVLKKAGTKGEERPAVKNHPVRSNVLSGQSELLSESTQVKELVRSGDLETEEGQWEETGLRSEELDRQLELLRARLTGVLSRDDAVLQSLRIQGLQTSAS